MNKSDAKKIAETITNEQIAELFKAAKKGIKNWEAVSIVNKGLTKGTAWNVLYGLFDVNEKMHPIGKKNIIREFGSFLPEELKIKKAKKKAYALIHQEPIL